MNEHDRMRLAVSVGCSLQTVRRWDTDPEKVGSVMGKALTAAAKRLGIERVEKGAIATVSTARFFRTSVPARLPPP